MLMESRVKFRSNSFLKALVRRSMHASDGVHAQAFSSAATVKISATKRSSIMGSFGLW